MFIQTQSPANQVASTRSVAALAAIFFGFIMILAVGFSPLAQVHNTTHDTRHATGFPCH